MNWSSIIAIYSLFWVLTAFVILPFGVRTNEELGLDLLPGQVESAPGNFNPKKVMLMTTLVSALVFGAYYLNYHYGWVDRHSFDIFLKGPNPDQPS